MSYELINDSKLIRNTSNSFLYLRLTYKSYIILYKQKRESCYAIYKLTIKKLIY